MEDFPAMFYYQRLFSKTIGIHNLLRGWATCLNIFMYLFIYLFIYLAVGIIIPNRTENDIFFKPVACSGIMEPSMISHDISNYIRNFRATYFPMSNPIDGVRTWNPAWSDGSIKFYMSLYVIDATVGLINSHKSGGVYYKRVYLDVHPT